LANRETFGPCSENAKVERRVEEVRPMKENELKAIFPDADVVPKGFFGVVKSWIAVGSFPHIPNRLK
jgi:hypothetical protein